MPRETEILILGQGLAGSLLSFELLSRGQKVLVVDDGNPQAASRVAAGLMSPVTGQRTALAWRAEAQLACASDSYRRLESALGQRFYHPLPLKRFYQSEDQRRLYRSRAAERAHRPWLGPEFDAGPLGGMEIKGAAWLDAPALVAAWRQHLQKLGLLIEARAGLSELRFEGGSAEWGGIQAKQAVCCLGATEAQGGLFDFLRFQPTRGELLTVSSPASQDAIRYGAHFAIPLGGGQFRVGATYDRENLDPQPTAEGRSVLEASAQSLLGQATVEAQACGIRPNLLGHFPALGAHPKIPQLSILNGFGSKGALWAPYTAKLMADWMLEGAALPAEIDIKRFLN